MKKWLGIEMLYIKRVELKNIRCFKHLKIDLTSSKKVKKWLMILGDNGVGKTTLLRCIAIGLCDEASAAALLRDTSGEMIRKNEVDATIRIELEGMGKTYTIITKITREAHFETIKQKTYPRGQFPWKKIFACGYGSNRRTEGDISYDSYMVSDAVYTLFNYDYPLQNPELAIRRYAETNKERKEICQWLDEILMLDNGSTRVTKVGIKIRDKSENVIELGALADGYQATLTLVLDMLGWAMLAGQKGRKSKLSGIVIIDEIDQHLHPSWQRKVISLLESRFPNIQFIVATHSPLCAGGTADLTKDNFKIELLKRNEDGIVECSDKTLFLGGWRADQILASELFGYIIEANDKTEKLLREASILAGKEKKRTASENARYRKVKDELKSILISNGTTLIERKLLHEQEEENRRNIRRLEKKLFGNGK